ncbi:ABC transporter permease [Bosea sp. (in: a-proteobacteria)]|uniref:ABC transporter permease n=1 Tax=Bosea sp. (in: a-proteobacteria) TaxID=1871050 RepID=UPI00334228B0
MRSPAVPGSRQALLALPGALWLLTFAVLPLGFLVVMSFWTTTIFGLSTEFTLDNYATIFSDSVYLTILAKTIRMALITTVLTLLFSYPVAYFLAGLSGRSKAVCLLLLFMPFWSSYVVRTFLWLPMLGRNGLLNTLLMKIGAIDEPIDVLLFSEGTVHLGLIYVYSLFMILPIYLSLDRLDQRLIEAAADLGAGPFNTFRRIVLPLSMPGVLSGSVMVFLLACGAYVTPQLLGGTAGVMFGNIIAAQYLNTNNWPLGAALSVVLVLVVLAGMFLVGRKAKMEEIFVGGQH